MRFIFLIFVSFLSSAACASGVAGLCQIDRAGAKGHGFVIGKFIVTAAHVVDGDLTEIRCTDAEGKPIILRPPFKTHIHKKYLPEARLSELGDDAEFKVVVAATYDLALIEVERPLPTDFYASNARELSSVRALKENPGLAAFGVVVSRPKLGLVLAKSHVASVRFREEQDMVMWKPGFGRGVSLMNKDAAFLRPGMSGAPLAFYDGNGRFMVLGISVARFTEPDQAQAPINLFAPISGVAGLVRAVECGRALDSL